MEDNRVQELKEKIMIVRNDLRVTKDSKRTLQLQIYTLQDTMDNLEKEIIEIEKTKFDNENQKKLIGRGYEFVGKANGENDYDLYAECHGANLDLFIFHTGVGTVLKGVCHKCGIEIDFTNTGNW